MSGDSHELMPWVSATEAPATVILILYGHSSQWGLVQPHSFAVFILALTPGAMGIAAVSPGWQEAIFWAKLAGLSQKNKITFL